MSLLVAFISGLTMGVAICILIARFRKKEGVLLIDRSNPGKDVYRFNVHNLDKLSSRKRITLDVDPNAKLSQE